MQFVLMSERKYKLVNFMEMLVDFGHFVECDSKLVSMFVYIDEGGNKNVWS